MRKSVLVIWVFLLMMYGCVNRVKKENRIEKSYLFSSVKFIEHLKILDSKIEEIPGSIDFKKNSIIITMNIEGKKEVEEFSIRTVTFDKSPSILKYRTTKGDFHVFLSSDTITDVNLDDGTDLMIFNKTKKKKTIENKLPLTISELEKDWKRIVIADIGTIDLSPELEIQSEEIKLKIEEFNQENRSTKSDEQNIVIQPKGVNQLNDKSLKKYCRVMLETIYGSDGEYQKLNEKIELNADELFAWNKEYQKQLQQDFSNTPQNIIEWFPLKIGEVNGMPCIHISYTRQIKDKPYVMVNTYKFFNFDRIHLLIISYRITEKDYWIKDLDKTLNSFRITNIK